MKKITFYKAAILIAIAFMCCPLRSGAYSVLTHEAIIDVIWDNTIQPLLLKKYPAATPDQLKEAHAYAYGGAIAPDMGYYPFGSKLFTNLVHYVRTGDFVNALFDSAQNINEYAFAIGALSHYYSDKYGHPIGTNHCVPIIYPKDKEKYGPVVTYEQDPIAHIRMEFGFDILQTARGNYASEKYHDYIGFQIARPVLEKAFLKTYGLDINDVFNDFPLAISTFRWVIKDFFPTITRAAWSAKKKDILKANPSLNRRKFEFKMKKANYYHEYGKKHEKPGFFPGVLAKIVTVLPKIGPLKKFKLTVPGPEAEKIFIRSFDTVQVHYTATLKKLIAGNPLFPDINFDTGNDTWPGEYNLADQCYTELLLTLKDGNFKHVNVNLKGDLIKFYGAYTEKEITAAGLDKWKQITTALDTLKALQLN